MIVVDASVAIEALLADGPARDAVAGTWPHAPHLIDSEVIQVLRRLSFRSDPDARRASTALRDWRRTAVTRHAVTPLVDRVWELRENLTAYDAGYVALAEALGCALFTADHRLARATGVRCQVTVVPR